MIRRGADRIPFSPPDISEGPPQPKKKSPGFPGLFAALVTLISS